MPKGGSRTRHWRPLKKGESIPTPGRPKGSRSRSTELKASIGDEPKVKTVPTLWKDSSGKARQVTSTRSLDRLSRQYESKNRVKFPEHKTFKDEAKFQKKRSKAGGIEARPLARPKPGPKKPRKK